MKLPPPAAILLLAAAFIASAPRLHAQAADIPSAQAPPSTQSDTQRGRALLDQMVAALGGTAWLNRTTIELEGHGATFFHGQPNPGVTEYHEYHRLPASGQPEAERFELTKKRDVIQVWTTDTGTEITYKGNTPLPKDQVADYFRRRHHSIETVICDWIHAPGVMIVYEGTSMVERHLADKVTVLSADNDAVTIETDTTTHLPLRRTFQWRNEQFHDHDEDAEQYDDYHTIQGLPTALTVTRYHNGEMISQRYIGKLTYNATLPPTLFDPTIPLHHKK